MCLFFSPSKPMKMPQLVTGKSMPFRPPLRLLPIDASHHSTLTRSPRVKPLTCLTTSFILHHQKKTSINSQYKEERNLPIHKFTEFSLRQNSLEKRSNHAIWMNNQGNG